jgi:hypothetical protein
MTAATVVTLSNVQPTPVEWLWYKRIPIGKLCLVDGDPSTGKSTLTLDLAARVSSGRAWPDGARNSVGGVLLLSAEDGLADTIAPRLAAAGADMAEVHALTEVQIVADDGSIRMAPPSLPRDIPTIRRIIRRRKVKLIIVDVLMAYLGGQVDSHRDQDVRRVLHELAALAEEAGCAIVLVRHLNKTAGGNALYRGGGSIGIIGAARAAFVVARDPNDSERRIFAVTKSNLAAEPPALAYRLVDAPQHGCARVDWEPDPVEFTASDLVGAASTGSVGPSQAVDVWLLELLSDGEVPAATIFHEGDDAGFSKDVIKRAKSRLSIGSRKLGKTGGWVWSASEERAKEAKGAAIETLPPSRSSRSKVPPSEGDLNEESEQELTPSERARARIAEFKLRQAAAERDEFQSVEEEHE